MEAVNEPIVVTPDVVDSTVSKLGILNLYALHGVAGEVSVYRFTPAEELAIAEMQEYAAAVAAESEGEL